jgi:hypothetical protein
MYRIIHERGISEFLFAATDYTHCNNSCFPFNILTPLLLEASYFSELLESSYERNG